MRTPSKLTPAQSRQLARVTTVLLWGLCAIAHAQASSGNFGQGLLNWAAPLIAGIGVLAICVAIGGAMFRPELIKGAAFTAVICLVLFFIIHNFSSLQSTLQQQ